MRVKTSHPKLLLLVLATACSLANREGPEATCADLESGAVNACQEGIIATCKSATMRYEVCDDKAACSAAWQEPGKFRCNQTDNLPILVPSPGAAGSASGGSGSVVSGGGQATGGSTAKPGAGCDPTGPCSIASTGSDDIDWYAVDDQSAYFSDCETVWSVPKAGGFPTVLATGLKDCSYGNIEIDATDLYFTENSSPNESVVRVPKAGGAIDRVVTAGSQLGALASDSLNLYWLDGFDIKKLPKLGGTEVVVASINISSKRLLTHGDYLYWGQSDSIARVSTQGPFPATPSSLPIGNVPSDFAVSDTSVFFTVEASGTVGDLPLGGGAWAELATSQSSPSMIAVDGPWVYWVSLPQVAEIRKVNITGGSPSSVAKSTGFHPYVGRIVTDSTHVYWSQGPDLMRAPK